MLYVKSYSRNMRHKKKTWTTYFVYVSEVSPNTLQALTSKSPRHWREHPCFYSCLLLYFWRNFRNKNLSGRFHYVYFHIKYYVTIRILFGLVILSAANIRKITESSKQKRINLQKTRKPSSRKPHSTPVTLCACHPVSSKEDMLVEKLIHGYLLLYHVVVVVMSNTVRCYHDKVESALVLRQLAVCVKLV